MSKIHGANDPEHKELKSTLKAFSEEHAGALIGTLSAIPAAIYYAGWGYKGDVAIAIIVSFVLAIFTYLLIISIMAFFSVRAEIERTHVTSTIAIFLAIVFGYSSWSKDSELDYLELNATEYAKSLAAQSDLVDIAQTDGTEIAEELIRSLATITSQAGSITALQTSQISAVETAGALQSTLETIRRIEPSSTPTNTPLPPDQEVMNVVRDYLGLLSENEIALAWDSYLTSRIKASIIKQYSREVYERYWEEREVEIIEFLGVNFNFDKTECRVDLKAAYYIDNNVTDNLLSISLKFSVERDSWLINTFGEIEVTN